LRLFLRQTHSLTGSSSENSYCRTFSYSLVTSTSEIRPYKDLFRAIRIFLPGSRRVEWACACINRSARKNIYLWITVAF
jgi:hypothetical protein